MRQKLVSSLSIKYFFVVVLVVVIRCKINYVVVKSFFLNVKIG